MPCDLLAANNEAAITPKPGQRLCDGGTWIELYSRAHLPSRFGDFEIYVFRSNQDDKEHVGLVRGAVHGVSDVLTRVHSECLTGDVLGSMRCDCREQLEMTMRQLGEQDDGILLYMRQEGRGIGLGNKVRAYALQQEGLDTVEANAHLGFDDDLRDYRVAALMLRMFGVASVQLATNNPRKVFGLRAFGVQVSARVPVLTQHNPHNVGYLRAKARKSGHMLPIS